jgi:hypothetical protein
MKKALTDAYLRTLRAPTTGRKPMKTLIIAAILFLPMSAQAQNQTTFRDSGGRTTGTATTDSQGTTTFRDAGGRTTGTATHSNQGSAGGTTTFRDAGGRTTGSASTPWGRR